CVFGQALVPFGIDGLHRAHDTVSVLQGDKQSLFVVNMYASGCLNAFFHQIGVLMPGLAKFPVDIPDIACLLVL
ncbi:hypothetical protein, partial [Salmonella enterica]|uniref:hypothetical protein n=1 Tax=Salmonella enterica TaxID=28901 RepID=UPI001C378470